jgi:putative peptide modification system cyclase
MDTPSSERMPAEAHGLPPPLLRAVVICDLVDSTALTEQLGDRKAAELTHRLDRLARDLVHRHGGREIDKTDGFLLLFDRPIQAVAFALDYQRQLRELGQREFLPLQARIGIHVGEVVLWENASDDVVHGAKPIEVEGLAKPVAARLMQLARPGQILLSGVAHAFAARAQDELEPEHRPLWRQYGRYRFKGVAEPLDVVEAGEPGVAPFLAPLGNGKARRYVSWWRRPRALAGAALCLLAIVILIVSLWLRSPPAIAFAERDWVVVGDLVNRTGQAILDDSLQTAFRIGLEQSRYVNVLSDLKVRDTLALMRRDPEKTRVDRAIGSEVAIRNGARALILPTIAEIGGHVRVTAEVIDPHSQATVYTETAEGMGFGSILPSLDKVLHQLRVRLGEALASVQADTAPLPQVTTANLDALRAYALGLQAYAHAQEQDAMQLFQHAVKLDPDFALAYIGIARVYAGDSDDANAYKYAHQADALKDRLPPRDRLYVEAWLSNFGPPETLLEKWRLLGKLYPDYYAAHYNWALFAWESENRYADAIAAIQPALSEHDPMRGTAYYTLGALLAAENRFDAALSAFHTAATLGHSAQGVFYACTYAAQRRFEEAQKLLGAARPSGSPSYDLYPLQARIAIAVDQGNWGAARELVAMLVKQADQAGPRHGRAARAIDLSLDEYSAIRTGYREALHDFIDIANRAMFAPALTNHEDDVFAVLLGAYLAARRNDRELAQGALQTARPQAQGSGYPNLEHMLAIVEAELAWRDNHSADAIARLQATRDGRELYLTHVALVDAYRAAGRTEDALREVEWLAEHRGRAYFESNSFRLLQPRNVAESVVAMLTKAELAHDLGRDEDAKASLAEFLAAWPETELGPNLVPRVQQLRAVLHLASRAKT